VTRYMISNFSFAILSFDTRAERLHIEKRLLSTIFHCPDCGPSGTWLGRYHPTSPVIRSSGLWNVQGLLGPVLALSESRQIMKAGAIKQA
jgi:hypothetical protein